MSPRVTVGISFFDEARRLDAAIRSVLVQSFDDFELLLIDDGSTDSSVDVARRSLRDPRVRLYSDGRRRHLGARLNEILARATGALIARMDGDDVMHPERLARQVAHLDREPDCDAVGTWSALIDEQGRPFAVIEGMPTPAPGRRLLERPPIAHATMMARAGWMRAFRYDEALTRAEDRDLWCRAGVGSRIDVIEEVLYLVHVRPRGPEFLSDYLAGQADLRRVLRRHGPRLAGPLVTARLVGASLAKSAVMVLADRVGASGAVVSRRGRRPTRAETARASEALRAVRQIP